MYPKSSTICCRNSRPQWRDFETTGVASANAPDFGCCLDTPLDLDNPRPDRLAVSAELLHLRALQLRMQIRRPQPLRRGAACPQSDRASRGAYNSTVLRLRRQSEAPVVALFGAPFLRPPWRSPGFEPLLPLLFHCYFSDGSIIKLLYVTVEFSATRVRSRIALFIRSSKAYQPFTRRTAPLGAKALNRFAMAALCGSSRALTQGRDRG